MKSLRPQRKKCLAVAHNNFIIKRQYFCAILLVTYEKTCVTLTVQVNIHDTTLVEKSGQAVSAFLRGDIHYGEYHRRKHTKISGTDRTAAFTDRLRGDCTGAETAIGKYAFRTVSGQPSDGGKALAILQNEGYIYAEHGRGTFCSEMMRHAHPSKNIAVVTTYLSDYIFPRVIQGIDDVLTGAGYSIVLKNKKIPGHGKRNACRKF